uniref:Aconitase/3-isopropylmalate dehydratase large subunit alpha/beta/alpha domain-containing protein n=1 Tax=Ananas comosus var. bracteatus TaxID=296719 RepID=A0A6V7QR41_ANACO
MYASSSSSVGTIHSFASSSSSRRRLRRSARSQGLRSVSGLLGDSEYYLIRPNRIVIDNGTESAFKNILTSLRKPGGGEYGKYYSLSALNDLRMDKLAYSIRILLESVVRNCDGFQITKNDVEKIIDWEKTSPKLVGIPFKPARVLLQDFIGVPVLVDPSSMRDAVAELGGDLNKINPLMPSSPVYLAWEFVTPLTGTMLSPSVLWHFVPVNLVVDHSVQADVSCFQPNGILYPDTVVGTDSHATMIDGLGIDGWGVGGVDAEAAMLGQVVQSNVLCMFKSTYEAITKGNPLWNQLSVPTSSLYSWGPNSTYIHKPPYFENMTIDSTRAPQCGDAYCSLKLGDTVTTDHISPAGSIHRDSSAAKYLLTHSQYISSSQRYKANGHDSIVFAGEEHGTGSSRDWKARALSCWSGVIAVMAKSFERIHRSNFIRMGIILLCFRPEQDAESLGLMGHERLHMDSEENCSKSESHVAGEGKESETLEKRRSWGGIKVEINGDLDSETNSPTKIGAGDKIGGEKGSLARPGEAASSSSPKESEANGDAIEGEISSKPAPPKGYGLKKWRRYRRDSNKEGSSHADSAQDHKRRLSDSQNRPEEQHKQKSDDLGLLIASAGFSIGADSENSEDRSSKSSTAASAPRFRHESVGFGRERGRAKSGSGKGSGHVVQQRTPRGSGSGRGSGLDASKKSRGDWARIVVENSHSSVESDLRSSNAAFVRSSSMVSNGKHSEKSVSYDGENSDDGQQSEEVRSAYYTENGSAENFSREDADRVEENGEKNDSHSDIDPFVESIVLLRTAQEALETEIQKLVEMGKDPILDDFAVNYEEAEGSSSMSFEPHILELNQKVEHLECKLKEASDTINAKELRLLELQTIVDKTQSKKTETESNDLSLLREDLNEMESEIELMLEKKMEAEVEYLIMTRTTQSWKFLFEDQIALFEEQKSLSSDSEQMMLKLRENESKAVLLKEQAEKLEAQCSELSVTAEVLKLHNRACKVSFFLFVQFVLLCIAIGLFLLQLLPQSGDVVPT